MHKVEHKVIIDPRREINLHLGRPLSDSEWNLIENERWPSTLEPAGIAAKIQQWRDATGAPLETATVLPLMPKFRADPARNAREELLSYLFGLMAARLES